MITITPKRHPNISIIVTTYNKEKYIKECLESIITQNINKEVICVDDCSTDGTWKILNEYAKKHKEFMLIRNPKNSGTCMTRYNGLMACSGEYVLFIDGDYVLLPQKLPEIYEEAKKHRADILEFSGETDGNENLNRSIKFTNKKISNLLQSHNKREISNQLSNKLISRRVYRKVISKIKRPENYDNFSDVLFFLIHFLKAARNLYQSDIIGYYYYDTRGMTHTSTNLELLKHYCNFHMTYRDLCDAYGETEELFFWKNIVCNQAVDAYLNLSLKEKQQSFSELRKLMSEDEIKFLIQEKKKQETHRKGALRK